ncbi:hypothetical protein [Woodsholea maritima]|uniref:hypothetical protein n=1 Tax=Woodsholea maritima TaxID=240237 RepID=UPI000372C21C|nr:hypothetical protein [Woodsholea maritima]
MSGSTVSGQFDKATGKVGKTPAPFSLRLTFEERAMLDRMAGDRPLGAFIRKQLFGDNATPRTLHQRKPGQDKKALAQALSVLGQSRLSSNINQIAKAAHLGSLPVGPELDDELKAACADIRAMRDALISALGLKPEADR